MKTYCAFLRGVNVNGSSMNMADVRAVFEQAGMQHVSSVLATGNIIFASDDSQGGLRTKLEKAMANHYQKEVHLFIKSVEEVAAMASSVPFAPAPDLHCYVFVAEDGLTEALMSNFRSITPIKNERGAVSHDIFYWQVPKGSTLEAGFSKVLSQKDLKDKLTSRNINTIKKVLAMTQVKSSYCSQDASLA